MRITRSDPEHLVIVDFPKLLGVTLFSASLLCLSRLMYCLGHPEITHRELPGCVIGALVFFGGGCLFAKRSVFDFDLVTQQLRWHRRGLFGHKGGVVLFESITSVAVESSSFPLTSVLSYRVTLYTTQGTIPMTESYGLGEGPGCEQVRAAICQALQKSLAGQMENDILALAAAGRKLDAIKLVARRYKLSVTQATQFVDDLCQ